MRILLITNWLPYPTVTGYTIRVYNLIKRITREHQVDLLTFVRESDSPDAVKHLETICNKVIPIRQTSRASLLDKVKGILFPWEAYQNEDMLRALSEITTQTDYDIVQIEDSFMAKYALALPAACKAKKVLTFIDIDFLKFARMSEITPKLKQKIKFWVRSQAMKYWEPRIAKHFDINFFTSSLDQQRLLELTPSIKTAVIPNGVDAAQFQVLPADNNRPSLLYTGNMDYTPNVDAMLYFCEQIFPAISARIPGLELYIVGLNPTKSILDLNSANIHVTGRVDDLQPYYQRSSACIVPLRAGGGTRLKILEAMAYGRPVISTTVGCEGISVVDGTHLMITDDPAGFAEKTCQVLLDPNISTSLVTNGRKLVESTYDWDVITQSVSRAYDDLFQ